MALSDLTRRMHALRERPASRFRALFVLPLVLLLTLPLALVFDMLRAVLNNLCILMLAITLWLMEFAHDQEKPNGIEG